jgi:hypothetical protein
VFASELIGFLRAHGFDDLDDTSGLSILNDAQNFYATAEPWPCLEKTATWATDAGQNTMVAQPADLSKILSLIDKTNGNKLSWMRRDTFMSRYFDRLDEQGNPCFYYLFGGKLYVWPAPATPVDLVGDYIFRPTDLTTVPDVEPLWLPRAHHTILAVRALVAANQIEGDMDVAEQFQREADRRYALMRDDLWATQYDRSETIIDTDDEYYFD